jgi:hypothetical protein
MFPGFALPEPSTASPTVPTTAARPRGSVEGATGPLVRLAGLWETPSPTRCRFSHTATFCTGVVMWCKDVFICGDKEESRTPYPCGVCIGVSSPEEW